MASVKIPIVIVIVMSFHMTSATPARPCLQGYKAAVYAHRVVLPPNAVVSRDQAVTNMMINVNAYRKQARLAAQQGAQIIVFPEDGIYGFNFTREAVRSYLEPIPNPLTSPPWVPCDEPGRVSPSDIMKELSCMAKNNRMFVVANIGDVKECDDPDMRNIPCPSDGRFQFNTDVAFDTTGKLVARYHKKTLFGEAQFNPGVTETGEAQRITFDTPFGRFGMFICFDVLFKDPAIMLAEQGIRNIAFPTAWMNSYPMLEALGFHPAWARMHRVNFLSANLHMPELRFDGSGIYSPSGVLGYHLNVTERSPGGLVVVDVPPVCDESNAGLPDSKNSEVGRRGGIVRNEELKVFEQEIKRDKFRMVRVQLNGVATGEIGPICMNETCCCLAFATDGGAPGACVPKAQGASGYGNSVTARYQTDATVTRFGQSYFAFGVFQGRHVSLKDWYFASCLLVRCNDNSNSTCGKTITSPPPNDVAWSFAIHGSFSTEAARYVYPEVMVHKLGADLRQVYPAESKEWNYTRSATDGAMLTTKRLTSPLLVSTLYSLDYRLDDPIPSSAVSNCMQLPSYAVWAVLLFMSFILNR